MPVSEVLTIRNKIIDAFKALGDTMTDEDGKRLWNRVGLGTPDRFGEQEIPCLAVDPGSDKIEYEDRWQTRKIMVISLCFQWRRDPKAEIDSYEQFEYYLRKLIEAYTFEDQLAGAIQIREAGSGPEIEGRDDPRPGGYLLMEVLYRHGRTQPTRTLDNCLDG